MANFHVAPNLHALRVASLNARAQFLDQKLNPAPPAKSVATRERKGGRGRVLQVTWTVRVCHLLVANQAKAVIVLRQACRSVWLLFRYRLVELYSQLKFELVLTIKVTFHLFFVPRELSGDQNQFINFQTVKLTPHLKSTFDVLSHIVHLHRFYTMNLFLRYALVGHI